jgi:hypothetical protein
LFLLGQGAISEQIALNYINSAKLAVDTPLHEALDYGSALLNSALASCCLFQMIGGAFVRLQEDKIHEIQICVLGSGEFKPDV